MDWQTVGPRTPAELGELGAKLAGKGITVSTIGLGLHYNEDLMVQLARNSDGNHIFVEGSTDLAQVFQNEFDTVLSVVAQEIVIEVNTNKGIRPIRVLNGDAEIDGHRTIVKMNQLCSEQEKYILLEVEVPPGKVNQPRELAQVAVSYANMETKATDRLSSTLSVNFTESSAEVEKKTDVKASRVCVLQRANLANEKATQLRDQGDLKKAKQVLEDNARYLAENAAKLKCDTLKLRAEQNVSQAKHLDGSNWAANRKQMRRLQYQDATQQAY